jgi:hypothetical protein
VFLLQEFLACWIPVGDTLSGTSVLRVSEGSLQYDLGDAMEIVVQWCLDAFISDNVNVIRLQNKLATTLSEKWMISYTWREAWG